MRKERGRDILLMSIYRKMEGILIFNILSHEGLYQLANETKLEDNCCLYLT